MYGAGDAGSDTAVKVGDVGYAELAWSGSGVTVTGYADLNTVSYSPDPAVSHTKVVETYSSAGYEGGNPDVPVAPAEVLVAAVVPYTSVAALVVVEGYCLAGVNTVNGKGPVSAGVVKENWSAEEGPGYYSVLSQCTVGYGTALKAVE